MSRKLEDLIAIIRLAETMLQELKVELSNSAAGQMTNTAFKPKQKKSAKRDLFLSKTSSQFVKWATSGNLPVDVRIFRFAERLNFLAEYGIDPVHVTPKRFAMWVKCYAEYADLLYESRKSNSARFALLKKKK